ncbi:unnamed protein product [[Candida] boidinii]|uniref:Unnamed protein product n=1 Tax=Candida boidinii TaxID=5477 RepID=A0ACB5UCN9_CANBO|nr:unnamed protein product [[Candida] boidinii]
MDRIETESEVMSSSSESSGKFAGGGEEGATDEEPSSVLTEELGAYEGSSGNATGVSGNGTTEGGAAEPGMAAIAGP